MTWRTFAACADSGVDFFDPNQTNQALMLCHGCPVADECLREALSVGAKDDPAGVWGGHTKAERDEMRPKGRRVKPCQPADAPKTRQRRSEAVCGTDPGYQRHVRERTTPCAPCREARRLRMAEWRYNKRGAA